MPVEGKSQTRAILATSKAPACISVNPGIPSGVKIDLSAMGDTIRKVFPSFTATQKTRNHL